MDHDLIAKICKQVYQKFPEVKGASPEEKSQGSKTLLVFHGKALTPDGKSMPRLVRVVVDEKGKIEKMTTSR